MTLLQLVLKNMRQRMLSTVLTTLSVTLGVALSLAILIIDSEGQKAFSQTDYGYELIVGPKGSEIQLVLNTVYHLYKSPGNIPYRVYEDLATNRESSADGTRNSLRGFAQWAVPYAVGDTWRGRRIVGTTPQLFGVDEEGRRLAPAKTPRYRKDQAYEFAEGRAFHAQKFEAVIGWDVAAREGLKMGSKFHATHGNSSANEVPDVHEEAWTVVGILRRTGTANDRVLFIPLQSFYAIFEHEQGLEAIGAIKGTGADADKKESHHEQEEKAYTLNADGTINVLLPKEKWEISAILVQTRGAFASTQLPFVLGNRTEAMAVSPSVVMSTFFETFLAGSVKLLLVISVLVTLVAGMGILVSIYNAIAARNREIAIMRALGATRGRIVAIICLEAVLVGLIGAILGLVLAHGMAWAGSYYMQGVLASGIGWWRISRGEVLYLVIAVVLCGVAGLAPAMKAYRTDVATNLS